MYFLLFLLKELLLERELVERAVFYVCSWKNPSRMSTLNWSWISITLYMCYMHLRSMCKMAKRLNWFYLEEWLHMGWHKAWGLTTEMQYLTSCLHTFQHFFSVYDDPFDMEEEEKVEVGKAEEVAEYPPIRTGPSLQFNYEDVRTFSWIFGLTLILVVVLARWTVNRNKPIIPDTIIIIHQDVKNESYDFFDSEQLTFLWRFCNMTTFECSWCPPGWIEHESRCYLIPNYTATWKQAENICTLYLGHLPVVLNERDQMFLSRLAIEYKMQGNNVEGVWIGLTDTELEGNFTWVNGKNLASNNTFWDGSNPNNVIPTYDHEKVGQDCAAIVPSKNFTEPKWHYTWDDIICPASRHFFCEIPNFPSKVSNYGRWDRVTPPSNNKSHAGSRTTT